MMFSYGPLYGHLPPISHTIQVRRTRYARYCWRSKDELISDVLLWTPARPLTSHLTHHLSKTNKICQILLKKQWRTHKWCSPMGPCTATYLLSHTLTWQHYSLHEFGRKVVTQIRPVFSKLPWAPSVLP